MQAIFDESGLSPGALYRYFKGKEEIVEAIAAETLGRFAAAVDSGPPGGPDEVLGRLLDAIDSVPLRDHRLRLALQIWGEAIVNPRVGGFVREAIDRRRERMAAELLVPEPDETARVLWRSSRAWSSSATCTETTSTPNASVRPRSRCCHSPTGHPVRKGERTRIRSQS
jgi:AcrR family transcriptional regulator